jgi:bacterioferritin
LLLRLPTPGSPLAHAVELVRENAVDCCNRASPARATQRATAPASRPVFSTQPPPAISFHRLAENAMKSDKEIIDILNGLLAGELTAVDQYLLHGETYADMGFTQLAAKALHESDHERQHARALIQRILFLEGRPNLAKRDALKIGETVPDMLAADLAVEYKVVGDLKKAMAACEKAQDYVTRDMLAIQLEDTEMDHAYYLEKQLRLIERVGLQNYQQSQIGSANPAA